jgi:isopenicillin-N N-acyltransferase-like protein
LSTAGHCTGFVATGRSTVDGSTYAGQTCDDIEWYEPVVLQIGSGEGEIGSLVYTYPGIVGLTGISAAGVSINSMSMRSTDNRSGGGVPHALILRKALQQTTFRDAVRTVLTAVRANGFDFILSADFAAVNIEATAHRERIRYISRHFGHANDYQESELRHFEAKPPPDSLMRCGRMNQLLDEASGRIDLEVCKALLSDHAGYPYSICRHSDPSQASQIVTCARVIYVPRERLMLVSKGPGCGNPWQELRVNPAVEAGQQIL